MSISAARRASLYGTHPSGRRAAEDLSGGGRTHYLFKFKAIVDQAISA
jgi:hypothetical protein